MYYFIAGDIVYQKVKYTLPWVALDKSAIVGRGAAGLIRSKKITIAFANFPPFGYVTPTGIVGGMDVETWKEIGNHQGLDLHFRQHPNVGSMVKAVSTVQYIIKPLDI